MNTLIIGKESALSTAIADELKSHGYEVIRAGERDDLPVQDFDICVDISARSIGDVKQVVKGIKKRIAHYILLSSYQVYPPSPRISPWQSHEIDLCDDTGFNTVGNTIRRYRSAERELKHIGSRAIAWTILRPSIVEVKKNPDPKNMWWFVSRILDGGPIVLPDDDDPLFRHVSEDDLAQAIRVLAGKKEAFYQTVHVTSHTLLSFESYARLIMNGLNRKLSVVRVPGSRWKSAGLGLPMRDSLRSSFIDDSPLLDKLGWQPRDEREWVQEYAKYLVENPLKKPKNREVELALIGPVSKDFPGTVQYPEPENWKLVGKPGDPCSFHLETGLEKVELPPPMLRTHQMVMGMAEEKFLLEQLPEKLPRIMGHNVLLELLEPGTSGMQAGSFYLPVAKRPCGDSSCTHCAEYVEGVSGVTDDGFGAKYVSLPQQHLVPVPNELQRVSLLADPLACLLSVIPSLLSECSEPVWVFGERIEALLALLLAKDAGQALLHVSRTKLNQKNLPFNLESMPVQRAQRKVQDKIFEQPGMVINLSGSIDGENLLSRALSDGGFLVTPFAVTQTRKRRVNVQLPLVAPGRPWLEKALERLRTWSSVYDLDVFLKPVSLDQSQDLFLGGQFCQSYVDVQEGNK